MPNVERPGSWRSLHCKPNCYICHKWHNYWQERAQHGSADNVFTRGRFFAFSPYGGNTFHRSKWNLAGRSRLLVFTAKFHLAQGCRFTTMKLWNCWILPIWLLQVADSLRNCYKIYRVYAHGLSFSNNSPKFACVNSINNNAINNFPCWGHFNQIFDGRWWLNYRWVEWWHGSLLYHHAKFGGNRLTHVGVRGHADAIWRLW